MASAPYRFFSWLLQRVAASVLIGALALTACALWLFVQDQRSEETRREQWIHRLTVERDAAQTALDELERNLSTDEADLLHQEERVSLTSKVIGQLDDLDSIWQRWFGNREQQEANAEQRARMVVLRDEAQAKIEQLKTRVTAGHDGRLAAILRVQTAETRLEKASRESSRTVYYLREAWLDVRWYLGGALVLIFAGPFLLRLWLYYGWARWTGRARPLWLSEEPCDPASASAVAPCINESLWPGEILRVRPEILALSADGLDDRPRGLLSWRFPLSSRWAGLKGLRDLRNGHAGEGRQVPLGIAPQDETVAAAEALVLVDVPEGSSFTIRLGRLAGLVFPGEQLPTVRRRWRFLSRQAWVSRQFRYFEFKGPSRLIVKASGLRVEKLVARDGIVVTERRLANETILGFSSALRVVPVRTERFWAYFTGQNPLWQAKFSGEGVVLVGDPGRCPWRCRLGRLIGL